MDEQKENNIEEAEDFINAGVVINKNREVLLVRRVKEEKGKDGSILTWAFPAGKQRFKETREECVKRELLAETGYDVISSKQISLRLHPQFSVMIVYHLCHLISEEPIAKPNEPHEIAEIRWVKLEEIRELITTDIDPSVAKELKI
jgi:mutator protein MutT